MRRVARHAVISLPIEWEMDDPKNPHHGIIHERVRSWFAPTEPTRVIVGNPGYRQRLIYVFENLGQAFSGTSHRPRGGWRPPSAFLPEPTGL